jgi:hypothetical protein
MGLFWWAATAWSRTLGVVVDQLSAVQGQPSGGGRRTAPSAALELFGDGHPQSLVAGGEGHPYQVGCHGSGCELEVAEWRDEVPGFVADGQRLT